MTNLLAAIICKRWGHFTKVRTEFSPFQGRCLVTYCRVCRDELDFKWPDLVPLLPLLQKCRRLA